jgi:hypothetical protein
MANRREAIKKILAIFALMSIPNFSFSVQKSKREKIWACHLHLSFNFAAGRNTDDKLSKVFETDEVVWDAAIKQMALQGVNMVVINLDDAILWESHPEIAVKNAWSPTYLRKKLAEIRKLGIEPIPLLNFSSTHDAWLGEYSRMLSTKKYYEVCKDLIAEAIDIFDTPRFFHLGMDEETYKHQSKKSHPFDYIAIRQNDLWWHDLYFYIDVVKENGVRPWVWSDYEWHHPKKFFEKMPKSVIQSNWYYSPKFEWDTLLESQKIQVKAYIDLEKAGYEQIPTASFHTNDRPESIGLTVEFCSSNISDKQLLGFMQTFWMPTIEKNKERILKGVDLIGEARRNFEKIKKMTN